MRRLDLTLASPAENVALDEALLDWAEEESPTWEFVRLWESPQPMVVVGRSSRVDVEVRQRACTEQNIPILRRSSGGAAIVAGPGCLMYAVVLSYQLRPELRDISRAHSFVLGHLADRIRQFFPNVTSAGTSDLVLYYNVAGTRRKFSGNSLRAKRSHLLYHGTLLYDFDLALISRYLASPPRQPEYRQARGHDDFVANLPIERKDLVDAVGRAFPTADTLVDWPKSHVTALVEERFGQESWNLTFG